MICPECGTELAAATKFCTGCGRATSSHRRQVHAHYKTKRRTTNQAVTAIATIYVGVLLGVMASPSETLFVGLEVTVGLVALGVLGRAAWRDGLGTPDTPHAWWWGPLMGVATFALSLLFVDGLQALLPDDLIADESSDDEGPSRLELWVTTVLLAPLLEEWLCRGVLWSALLRVTSTRNTLVLSACLFGLLHCLGSLLGFPHRFVAGLGFGWLRDRSGSIWPGVLAHAMHNGLAVAWA